ncbi:hypothetical protein GB937_005746 [Aspergillus fischeri]|nr:hypothetical protein GB937_005746 [Aspergillus fischeri]
MKPVVSVLNAWSCVVISAFAIVILSILGSLYKSEHHGFVGSESDPEDGGAVAASIFTAVVIYAVSLSHHHPAHQVLWSGCADTLSSAVFLRFLCLPGLPAHEKPPGRCYIAKLDNFLYIPRKKTWNSPFDLCPSYETKGYVKCLWGRS